VTRNYYYSFDFILPLHIKICYFFVFFLFEAQNCFAFTGDLVRKRVSDLQVAERYLTGIIMEKEYTDSCQIK
jgi:hypothetical protein